MRNLSAILNGQQIDMYPPDVSAYQFTYTVIDARDPSKKQMDTSRAVKFPATARNNIAFGHSHDVNEGLPQKYRDYDITRDSLPIVIYADGLPIFTGLLKLNGTYKAQNPQYYEGYIIGNNSDWFDRVAGIPLATLPLGSFYYTRTNVESSWDLTTNPVAVFYPVNYGQWSGNAGGVGGGPNSSYVRITDLRPHIRVVDMISTILNQKYNSVGAWAGSTTYNPYDFFTYNGKSYVVLYKFTSTSVFDASYCVEADVANIPGQNLDGYKLSSNFFSSTFGQGLTWLFIGGKWHLQAPEMLNMQFDAGRITTNFPNINTATTTILKFNSVSSPYYDNGGNYSTSTGIYTAGQAGKMAFQANLNINALTDPIAIHIRFNNGSTTTSLASTTVSPSGGSINVILQTGYIEMLSGDQVWVEVGTSTTATVTFTINSFFSNVFTDATSGIQYLPQSDILEGSTLNIGTYFPNEYTQDWFIREISKLFDLVYYTDVLRRTVYIEPRSSFFKSISTALDWTEKMDYIETMEYSFVVDGSDVLKRQQQWAYTNDDNDAFTTAMNAANIYQLYSNLYKLPDRFDRGIDIYNSAFAATGYLIDKSISPSSSAPAICPRMWDLYLGNDTSQPAPFYDFKPRILYYQGKNTNMRFNWYDSSTVENYFPYAYAFDPTGADGDTTSLAFNNLPNSNAGSGAGMGYGLFQRYYYPYYQEIVYGGLLTAFFHLTPADINQLDLRIPIVINNEDGQSFWKINQIIDYEPGVIKPTKVELIKMVPITSEILGNTGGNNNGGGPQSGQQQLPGPGDSGGGMAMMAVKTDSSGNPLYNDPNFPAFALRNGSGNQANGYGSLAAGFGVIADGYKQTALGLYNSPDGSSVLIIGAGSGPSARLNALTVDVYGNIFILDDGVMRKLGNGYGTGDLALRPTAAYTGWTALDGGTTPPQPSTPPSGYTWYKKN